jgi:hypothetical protein
MPAKEIANEDRVIVITSNGPWTPGPATGMTWIEIKAGKTKLSNKFAMINQISWVALGCTFGGHTFVSGGSVEAIMATATKCKCDNMFVLRKDDQGSCAGTFTNNSSGATVPCTCSFKIDMAGQVKVKGE